MDRTIPLPINGSTQRIRLCTERAGLPPLLVVQAGPGLPLLHEVVKFQRLLNLEQDFLVAYWEQRGCGDAPLQDARSVSLRQQVDDLGAVLRWLHRETGDRVVLLGISLGGSMALQAAERDRACSKAVVAISPDANTAMSDAAALDFLRQQAARAGTTLETFGKLGPPPYVDPAVLRRRTRLLADFGSIERGRRFNTLMRELLVGLLVTYGIAGAIRALRNMNVVQRALLPEVASLDLLAHAPRVLVPVHYIFGEDDALTPAAAVKLLPTRVGAPTTTVSVLPNAGHMVHFDRPDAVRSIVLAATHDRRRVAAVGQ